MLFSNLDNISIEGIASAVSGKWDSLENYYEVFGKETVQKFTKMTGVQGRYMAGPKQTTSDFAYAAAKEILEKKSLDPSEIQALVYVTQMPDYSYPATACVLQHRLGLPKDCIAFDVNLGCSGFVYGVNILGSLMRSGNIRRGLLLLGDTSASSQQRNQNMMEDDSGRLLFGDSGAAVLLENTPETSRIKGMYRSDGSRFQAIINPGGAHRHLDAPWGTLLDNIAVFNFTISEVPNMINGFLESEGRTSSDYDCLVLHQANLYIMKQVAKRVKFPLEKVPVSIDTLANTSSATIPNTLVKEYGDSQENKKLNALMCGFGIGLSWGIVSAEIDTKNIFPLVHTDEYFDDGMSGKLSGRWESWQPTYSKE